VLNAAYSGRVGFRYSRRKSLGGGLWGGLSKSGLSGGRRGRRGSLSVGRRGVGGSVRLLKGLSYVFRGEALKRIGVMFVVLVGTALVLSGQAVAVPGANGVAATAAMPLLYKNCTNLNKKYLHGLGKLNAKDKTSGDPVTTFKRSTRLYNIADGHNKGLDRDNDGIACEKK